MNRALLGMLLLLQVACGGSSSSPTSPSGPPTPAPPANIAGTYTITITASSACTELDPCGRRATFTGTLSQSGATVTLTLTRPPDTFGNFWGTVSGATVSLAGHLADNNVCRPDGYQVIGTFNGTASGRTISGSLDGQVVTSTLNSCAAANHAVVFTRQ